jgi:MFS family permease
MAGYRALLADPAQRRLLLGSAPADFADWLDYVALVAVIVYVWQHGPFELALFAIALTLPYVTAGPFLAAWVDRTSLKRVLVVTNVVRAAATLSMAVAPNVVVLLLLVLLRSFVDSAFNPARQAALQAITAEPQLTAANALHAGLGQTAKVLGPAIGGGLMLIMPVQGVFVVNGALSALSVLGFALVTLPPRPPTTEAHPTIWSQFGAGFAEFRKSRLMFAVLVFVSAAHFCFFLYDTLLGLLNQQLGFGATELGLGVTASGVGGLIGAAIGGRVAGVRPLLPMAIAQLISGPITIALAIAAMTGVAIPFWAFLIALGTMGGTTVFMMILYRAVLQRETPPDRIARVVAAGEAIIIVALMTAPFIGSALASAYGIGTPFLVAGVLVTLIGIAGLVSRV